MCNNLLPNHRLELSQLLIENINNKDTFAQLLLNGANINSQNNMGWCILFETIYLKLQDKIQDFLEYKINMNIRDTNGRNALFWSIYFDNIEASKILLTFASDLIVCSKQQLHVFHYAVYKNNLALIKYLIEENQIDIETKDNLNCTPLIYAALYKKTEIIEYLIEKGADLNCTDSMGNCANSLIKKSKYK
ncbi:ankyrin repeat domain-containing protein [Poseidonibacter lekithochrous]|uniref:ankyrin repeat domain-containing protein n=1 Tax=Poseidonibacter lekithochrous TaxID=1904463 RepID=UPI000D34AA27|nr:ankyrin repeat domain-containing protein [Poseidonibacter lekithochrous]